MSKLNREWTVQPHGPVEQMDEGLLTVAGEIAMPLGRFPRRMTVVALKRGGTAIWSAIPLREPAMREIEALGVPKFLVIPGIAHRLDAAAWKARYPAIKVLCPPGARDAAMEAVPVDATHDILRDPDSAFETVPGTGAQEGALTVTRGERTTLVLNDILANVRNPHGFGAQIMARLFGFGVSRPRLPRPVASKLVDDPKSLAANFRRWADLPGLARVIVGHGDVITDNPRAVLLRVAGEVVS